MRIRGHLPAYLFWAQRKVEIRRRRTDETNRDSHVCLFDWLGPDAGANGPYVGRWKLNIAKSKFTGAPPPQSETRTVVAQGNGYKITFDGTDADGSRIAFSLTSSLDGKPVPVSGSGIPGGADTAVAKRLNPQTIATTATKAGKVVGTIRTVVSKDGKVTTQTTKGKNGSGQPLSTLTIWDKE